jgi:hypothetical protein
MPWGDKTNNRNILDKIGASYGNSKKRIPMPPNNIVW